MKIKLLRRVMYIMVSSCKKTTELIDKKAFVSLTLKEKLQLHVHKSMCKTCSAYEQQSKFLDRVIGKWLNKESQTNEKLSTIRKNEILEEINKS